MDLHYGKTKWEIQWVIIPKFVQGSIKVHDDLRTQSNRPNTISAAGFAYWSFPIQWNIVPNQKFEDFLPFSPCWSSSPLNLLLAHVSISIQQSAKIISNRIIHVIKWREYHYILAPFFFFSFFLPAPVFPLEVAISLRIGFSITALEPKSLCNLPKETKQWHGLLCFCKIFASWFVCLPWNVHFYLVHRGRDGCIFKGFSKLFNL